MPWLLLVSVAPGPSPGMEADQTIISFNDVAREEEDDDEVNLKELDDELKRQKQRQVRCSHVSWQSLDCWLLTNVHMTGEYVCLQ